MKCFLQQPLGGTVVGLIIFFTAERKYYSCPGTCFPVRNIGLKVQENCMKRKEIKWNRKITHTKGREKRQGEKLVIWKIWQWNFISRSHSFFCSLFLFLSLSFLFSFFYSLSCYYPLLLFILLFANCYGRSSFSSISFTSFFLLFILFSFFFFFLQPSIRPASHFSPHPPLTLSLSSVSLVDSILSFFVQIL